MTALRIVTDVKHCARCGENHQAVAFEVLKNPIRIENAAMLRVFMHWAACPITKEPILLEIQLIKE